MSHSTAGQLRKRPVGIQPSLGEPVLDSSCQAEICSWIDLCIDALHRSDREELTETYYQQYRQLRLEDGMERLLAESLGGRCHHLSPSQIGSLQPLASA